MLFCTIFFEDSQSKIQNNILAFSMSFYPMNQRNDPSYHQRRQNFKHVTSSINTLTVYAI